MKFFMDIPQFLVRNMRVNLCGRDRGVTEQRLDTADVGAVLQEIGRIGVAQGVWRHGLGNPGGARVLLH